MFNKESQIGLRLFFLAIISIALMVTDHRTKMVNQLRTVISIPLTPLQYLVSSPIQFIDNLKNLMSTHDTLVKENFNLKAEQLLLKAQMQRYLAIESENNQLKALLKSASEVQGKVLVAEIMAVDTEPFVNQIVLDKGENENVFVGQPVLDATGVMGQVIQVMPSTSRVLLVTDPHSGVPVQNTRSGVRAIAIGDSFSGKIRLANVPQTADIRADDIFLTSGLGQRYPAGYPLGRVVSVVKDPGLQFSSILVEPAAQLDRSREVLLIWPAQKVEAKVDTKVK